MQQRLLRAPSEKERGSIWRVCVCLQARILNRTPTAAAAEHHQSGAEQPSAAAGLGHDGVRPKSRQSQPGQIVQYFLSVRQRR